MPDSSFEEVIGQGISLGELRRQNGLKESHRRGVWTTQHLPVRLLTVLLVEFQCCLLSLLLLPENRESNRLVSEGATTTKHLQQLSWWVGRQFSARLQGQQNRGPLLRVVETRVVNEGASQAKNVVSKYKLKGRKV